jgi:hypothetical protein
MHLVAQRQQPGGNPPAHGAETDNADRGGFLVLHGSSK